MNDTESTIVAYLSVDSNSDATAKDIAKATRLTEAKVRRTLKQMLEAGKLTQRFSTHYTQSTAQSWAGFSTPHRVARYSLKTTTP